VELKNVRAPRELRAALTGYFKGDLDRLAAIDGVSPAHRSSKRSGTRCPKFPRARR
jgi:hypothetical protein